MSELVWIEKDTSIWWDYTLRLFEATKAHKENDNEHI